MRRRGSALQLPLLVPSQPECPQRESFMSPEPPQEHDTEHPWPDVDADAAITAIAPFYDLDFGAIDRDIDMYRQFARRGAGRVLELGAGTGRVAAALATDLNDDGGTVVAVEANAAMLRAAAARLQGSGVKLVDADFTSVTLDTRFDLVICALSTFCHLQTRSQQRRALDTVARHLEPHGLAVFDLPALSAADWELDPRPPLLEWVRQHPESARTVMKFATLEAHPPSQTQLITYLYDELHDDGSVQRTVARFPLRHVFRYEMEALLEAAGLALVQCYGSYELDPVSAGERLIMVARLGGTATAGG